MLPGMIGAVKLWFGPKSLSSGTDCCRKNRYVHGQGAWLGLFTSYAPVVNPRLAVVVITRGTDAHGHLPAGHCRQHLSHLKSAFRHPD